MPSIIEQQLDEGILTITLNRPDKLNALNSDVLQALYTIFCEAKHANEIKGLLITGEGKAFCAGADIQQLAVCDTTKGYDFACFGQKVLRALETLGKPSLAAVNGYAFGGGCELAIAATLRIAANTALFGQPEVKLGIIPGYGGTQRLARLIGKGRAMDLCLTGRSINADTALHYGLVSDVVPCDQLLIRAKEYLQSILAMAPHAINSIMDVIDRGYDLDLPDALHLEALHFAKVCGTKDKIEGVAAFLEKRKPQFEGV